MRNFRSNRRRGGALLAVLWLTFAMSAIVFALARGVRAEFDRAALNLDSTRAYYLALGGVEATLRRIAWPRDPEIEAFRFAPGQRFLQFRFPTGAVAVEIIGEDGKLDVNQAQPEAIARVLAASGVEPVRAVRVAAGIVRYRERVRAGEMRYGLTAADAAAEFFGGESSFLSAQSSIQELEELLSVPGVTPDLLYGGYREDSQGGLALFGGLYRNLTTRGSGFVNVNYASPEMLAAAGMGPALIQAIEEIRRIRPLGPRDPGMEALTEFNGPIRLGLGGQSAAYTIRATAELTAGRARRRVAALAARGGDGGADPIHIARWFDTAF